MNMVECYISIETIIYSIFLIGAFLNFLPQIIGFSLKDPQSNLYPTYLHELSSLQFKEAIIACIAATVPIFLEFLLETILAFIVKLSKSDSSNTTRSKKNIHKLPFQEVVFLLIVPDLTLLCWILPFEHYDFLTGLLCARDTMFVYSFLAYMVRLKNRIWTWPSTIMIAASFMIANILLTIEYQILSISDDVRSAIAVLLPFFVGLGFLTLIITLVRWIWYLRTCPALDKSEEMRDNLCSVYAFFYTVFIFGDWFIFFFPVVPISWSNLGVNYLTLYTYLMAGCILMTTVITNRLTRMDANETKLFMRYISHEIRTPLNTVFLGLRLLHDELQSNGNVECLQMVKDTQESCQVAIGILSEMLMFDKVESGLLVLEKETIPPVQFIKSILSPFTIQAREAGVNFIFNQSLHPDYTHIALNADPNKLAQVIRNLVSNAMKFTKRDGTITVSVSAELRTSTETIHGNRSSQMSFLCAMPSESESFPLELVLSVTDSGAGISKENQARLFKGVVQFNPGKLQGGQGTGLGLFITKSIVDVHGGTISVHSEGEGLGSTFTVRLPLERGDHSAGFEDIENRGEEDLTLETAHNNGLVNLIDDTQHVFHAKNLLKSRSLASHESFATTPPSPLLLNIVSHPYSNHNIIPFDSAAEMPLNGGKQEHQDGNLMLQFPLISKSIKPSKLSYSQIHPHNEGGNDDEDDHSQVSSQLSKKQLPEYKILVVDDSAITRKMTIKLFTKKKNAKCDQAEDGLMAVNMIRTLLPAVDHTPNAEKVNASSVGSTPAMSENNKPFGSKLYDLILMDDQMPQMDGPAAIVEIRRMGYSGLIFGLTGNGMESDQQKMISAGANKVLLKPIDSDLLWEEFLAMKNFLS